MLGIGGGQRIKDKRKQLVPTRHAITDWNGSWLVPR